MDWKSFYKTFETKWNKLVTSTGINITTLEETKKIYFWGNQQRSTQKTKTKIR
jgi:hypothetical protein